MFGNLREKEECAEFPELFLTVGFFIQEKLEDLGQKGCEFRSSGLPRSSPPLLEKKKKTHPYLIVAAKP